MSIFGEYSQLENRVTAAFLQICKIGGEDLIRYIASHIGLKLPSSEIQITSQVKADTTVPDGLLASNFAFKLYVESKVAVNAINLKQLQGHLDFVNEHGGHLLYITPDSSRPTVLPDTVYWISWKSLADLLTGGKGEYTSPSSEIDMLLAFLIENFITLLNNNGLIDIPWGSDEETVAIVGGRFGEDEAISYGVYICQNNRSFRPCRYIAFYKNNRICNVFEIEGEPESDVILAEHAEFSTYLANVDPNHDGEPRKVFRLKNREILNCVINDKVDKNGNLCPYTYGSNVYTTIEKLRNAKNTSEL